MLFLMKKMPKSIRIFIRKEKARIRRQFFDVKKQNEMIAEIYKKLSVKLEQPAEKIKVQDIHNLFIRMGMDADFRGKDGVQDFLDDKKKRFEKLSEQEKQEFDKDALENPYLDSGVYNISDDKEIKKVLVGIDISPAEILIA